MTFESRVAADTKSGVVARAMRSTIRAVAILAIFSLGVASPGMAANGPPQPAMSEPVAKEFRDIRHYLYRERMYEPPAPVEPMKERPAIIGGPEEQMANLIASMRNLQFDRWLAGWDTGSQALIQHNLKSGSPSKAQLFRLWKERFRAPEVRLVRWIETREYVILTYRSWGPRSEDKEYPVAFKLGLEGWAATLDLMNDPVFLNFGSGKQRIERDGRS